MVSQCVIDWFYTWPEDALRRVGEFFLAETKLPAASREAIVSHLVYAHQDVIARARAFANEQRRFYYVTPKNYLDFLSNYIAQLQSNRKKNQASTQRLQGGLTKLVEAAEAVDRMQIELTDKKVIVDAKTKDVEVLIVDIEGKTKIANVQQIEASEKQVAANAQSEVIEVEKAKAAEALMEALPAVAAASEALENLDKKSLDEIKAFAKPPALVQSVCMMVICLAPVS